MQKPSPAPTTRSQVKPTSVPSQADADWQQRVAEAAYYRAEQRHFEPGHELDDWLEAERALTAPAAPKSSLRH